jgi:HK97 family phage major capsid protein
MSRLLDLKEKQRAALERADAILKMAEDAKRPLSESEDRQYKAAMADFNVHGKAVREIESASTISRLNPMDLLDAGKRGNGTSGAPTPGIGLGISATTRIPGDPVFAAATRTPEYAAALYSWLKSGGKAHTSETLLVGADAAGGYYWPGSERFTNQRNANGSFPTFSANLYEGTEGGSDAAGGYAINIPTVPQIVPLAMPDLGIFDASTVIPTATDIKIPQAASLGTSALKSESTGTIATFGGTDPTLGQITLTAFMAGALRLVSWELLQDVPAFQSFIVDDLIKGQRILEGSFLATGNGTSEALGVFGNTGTGTGSPYELVGTSADSQTLLNSLFDVTSTLRGQYQANASWIMSRATGLTIRRAQMQTNLFAPVATVDADGTERILGRPVFYDVNAPSLPTTTNAGVIPILFGDFKQGYIIGIRGGAGINIKILDQPYAAQGQLGVLCYRRLDGRVRRSEAIQQIEISHS